jgi:hypothetical protein
VRLLPSHKKNLWLPLGLPPDFTCGDSACLAA